MSNLSDPPDSPRYETPPGTPPPPYALKGFSTTEKSPGGTTHFQLTQESILKSPFNLSDHFNTGAEILNMEDDDDDDDELLTLSSCTFICFFLNFVISISDPAPLLFYLITDSYKQGSLKEMQRWAYEIHSSFLVPGAPLPINKIENNTVNVIDRALQEEFEKEEILRRLFWKKKDNGLGGIFGHSELELRQCIDNRNRELQVIDNLMIPLLDSLTEDLDNATERSFTIASSLATILSKTFVTRNPTALSLIEKCPTFVSKEKKIKQTLCQIMIWGIGPQGYRCSNCGFDVYRKICSACRKKHVRILSDRDLSAAVHPWKSTTQSPNTTKEIIPSSSICNDDFLDDPNSTLLSVSSALLFDQTENEKRRSWGGGGSTRNSSSFESHSVTSGEGTGTFSLSSSPSSTCDLKTPSLTPIPEWKRREELRFSRNNKSHVLVSGSSTLRHHRRERPPPEMASSTSHHHMRHKRSQSEIYYCSSHGGSRPSFFNDSTITTTTNSIQRVMLPPSTSP
ncbi:ARHGEF12 [Lepeophtheirus salmonis]|uniref:ARHGEF12 n=1 Tax=Lepeophtheirus salmonis TaxID=72036 RepID=A0A7R8H9U0_LEPSM|nr:ARHGEF12 [Lepeophtheirus salmonis]CAF2946540.1 ARHGEF12 [Lepeophtheirus salmonis]